MDATPADGLLATRNAIEEGKNKRETEWVNVIIEAIRPGSITFAHHTHTRAFGLHPNPTPSDLLVLRFSLIFVEMSFFSNGIEKQPLETLDSAQKRAMKLLLVRIRWPCPIWLTTPRINKTWGRRLLSPLERGGNYFAASFYSPLFLANSNVISTYHHNSDGGESWRLFSLRPLARVGLLAEFLHSVFLFILFYDGPKEIDWSPTFLAYLVGIHLIRPWSLITLLFWPVMCNSTSQPTNFFPFFGQQVFDLSSWCIHARFRLHLLVKKLSIRLCVYFQCVSYFFPSHRFQIIWFLCNQFGIVVSIACKYSPWNVHVATLARSVTVLSLWNDSSYQMSCDRPPNDFVQ